MEVWLQTSRFLARFTDPRYWSSTDRAAAAQAVLLRHCGLKPGSSYPLARLQIVPPWLVFPKIKDVSAYIYIYITMLLYYYITILLYDYIAI